MTIKVTMTFDSEQLEVLRAVLAETLATKSCLSVQEQCSLLREDDEELSRADEIDAIFDSIVEEVERRTEEMLERF